MSVTVEVPVGPANLSAALQDEPVDLTDRLGNGSVKNSEFLESLTGISAHYSAETQAVPDLFDAPPLHEVESLLVVVDLGEVREPDRLFRFIKVSSVRTVPEYIDTSQAMTIKQRETCVTLESVTTGAKVNCYLFARVEKGVSTLTCLHIRRKVEHAFLEEGQTQPRGFKEIYHSLCDRFLDALRTGYTFPDLGKSETLAVCDWSFLQPEKAKASANKHAASNSGSSGSTEGDDQNSKNKGKEAEKDASSEDSGSDQTGNNSKAGKGGNGGNSDSDRSKNRRKNKHQDTSDNDSTSEDLATDKAKKSRRKRKRFERSSESDSETEASQAKGRKQKGKRRRVSQEVDPSQPGTSRALRGSLRQAAERRTRRAQRKHKPLMKKPKCCDDCRCWKYGRDAILENFSMKRSKAEREHMALIHEHLCHKSLFDKMTSEAHELALIRESMEAQEKKLDDIVEYTKVTANEKKYNQQRANDLAELNLPFYTNTDLLEAVDNKFEVLVRAMDYFGYDEQNGEGFFANYLKNLMHQSLLYRMYTSKSNGKKTVSGKLFVYGCEYFRLAKKFENAMIHFAEDRWPSHFPKGRANRRIYSLLEHYRKIRSTQMRNFLCYKTREEDAHDLYRMIWWDNELCQKSVFDRPAPLWTEDKEAQNAYVKKFKKAWRKQVRGNSGLRDWKTDLPNYQFDPSDSTAEKAIMAPQASPEPYWTFMQ